MIVTHSHSIFVRNAPWRIRLEALIEGLTTDPSPERWHEIREAFGRLAVWLQLADQEELRQSVKTLHRAIGQLRDLDVLQQQAPVEAGSSDRSRSPERKQRQSLLLKQMQTANVATLLQRVRTVPPLNYETAAAGCRHQAQRVLKAGRRFARDPSLSSAHRLRRRLRELRFAREWLRLRTGPLRPLVRKLGDLHDRSLAAANRGPVQTGKQTAAEMEHSLDRCRTRWKRLRRQVRRWC